jgi:hypothetical protein
MLDLKKAVGRTQTTDTLMGSLVVIVFDPISGSLNGLLEAVELGPKQKLALDAFPESLDLTQCHGMVRTRSDMFDPVLLHFPLKPGLASPVGVLAAVVGKHLTRYTILSNPPTVCLEYMRGGLASIKTQTGDVTRVVVQKAD